MISNALRRNMGVSLGLYCEGGRSEKSIGAIITLIHLSAPHWYRVGRGPTVIRVGPRLLAQSGTASSTPRTQRASADAVGEPRAGSSLRVFVPSMLQTLKCASGHAVPQTTTQ